ncbi:F420-dependent oxidoreductase-like protein [Actinocorallia herbida]|uniref:F420-dependent oxidoreductase-like protein n=1 Tax=Actinocorallia herbida TaxID=58109 RepID=A0A3N1D308_9ACTN|nr:LLM class F420-dependent oxidoreductase [Actinocorallia herbida]ROO87911.1 F420-dependent oxidoreductase-like protein [Actinocorallia herbida]
MKLSTTLPYAADPRTVLETAVAWERAGLDLAWVAEAYGFDAPSQLGYLAARTETLLLGTGILNVYSRTPALIGQTAAGIDALSGGRLILGLGASGPQVIEGFHGLPYAKPLARTRDVVEVVRKTLRREAVVHEGPTVTLPLQGGTGLGKPLKLLASPVRSRVPIHVAALGGKNVELVAEIADGWLPLFFLPERAAETFGPALEAGKAKRDASLGELDIVAGGILAIGDDQAALRDLARPQLALYIGGMGAKGRNFYNDLVRRYGFEAEAEKIQDLYLSGRKKEAEAAVPDELIDQTNLLGPEGFVKERLAAYRAAGVTVLNVDPQGDDPASLISRVKSWL